MIRSSSRVRGSRRGGNPAVEWRALKKAMPSRGGEKNSPRALVRMPLSIRNSGGGWVLEGVAIGVEGWRGERANWARGLACETI